MNNRERFDRVMHFKSVDHPPIMLGGPWPATQKRWEREGYPVGVDLYDYFGLERFMTSLVAVETVLHPPFKEQVLEETGEFIVKINAHGVKEKNFRDGSSMPEFLDYPIKSPADLDGLLRKLDPETPGRIDPDWLAKARHAQRDGKLVLCNGGMYFAFLNEHMGTERLLYVYFDNPDFIHAVNERLCALCEQALRTILPFFRLDFVGYHEDMAYKTGPLISPEMFKEFMTPYYKRIAAICAQYGCDMHYMDSDGDIRKLIPLWLECGIRIMSPLEVAAGMDPVALRAEYGHSLGMIGGFDKRILAAGKEAIKLELERLRPAIEGGGYQPTCDHGVPPDVSWPSYRYFVESLKTIYGMA